MLFFTRLHFSPVCFIYRLESVSRIFIDVDGMTINAPLVFQVYAEYRFIRIFILLFIFICFYLFCFIFCHCIFFIVPRATSSKHHTDLYVYSCLHIEQEAC